MRHHCKTQHGYDPDKSNFPVMIDEGLDKLKEIRGFLPVDRENLMNVLNLASSVKNGQKEVTLTYIQFCKDIIRRSSSH